MCRAVCTDADALKTACSCISYVNALPSDAEAHLNLSEERYTRPDRMRDASVTAMSLRLTPPVWSDLALSI